MNAVCAVYVSTAQLVLQAEPLDAAAIQNRLLDISRLLPHLRQLLSCVVCCRLLSDPYAPRLGRCQHNVCRLCVRGRKSLRPLCAACKDSQDLKAYTENRQLHCLLLCYKSLCTHLTGSPLFGQLSKQRPPHPVMVASQQPSIPLPHMSTQELVLEGASYEDLLNSFNQDSAPRAAVSRLPIASLHAQQQQQTPLSTAAVTPAATPPPHSSTYTAPKAASPPTTLTTATLLPSTAAPLPIKREPISTPPLLVAASHAPTTTTATVVTTAGTQTTLPLQQPPQTLTIKHLRNIVDLSAALHGSTATPVTAAAAAPNHNNGGLPKQFVSSGATITYVGGSHTPGIVVPIVSSASATTTAPLTIASAKLQTLNRQWAQARQQALNNAATAAGVVTTTLSTKPVIGTAYKLAMAPTSIVMAATSAAHISTMAAGTATLQTVAANNNNNTITTTATTCAAPIAAQLRQPPPIKTVSNGSAMYSVLYTGIGNKITIKRKTDGDEEAALKKSAAAAASSASMPAASNVFRPLSKTNAKRRGCRCGNATATPGKLTCCGQRCPCYVESKSCIGCKCRGCRNPHRPDGGKVRPVIPELACYEIQMADESSSLSPNELLPIASSGATAQQQLEAEYQSSSSAAMMPQLSVAASTTTGAGTTATLIPLRSLHQFTSTSGGHQQQQQVLGTMTSAGHHGTTTTSNVLLQNAEGKYQVVPLHHFTTAGHQNQNVVTQIAGLQRGQTLTSVNSTFILPNANVVACPTAGGVAVTTTSSALANMSPQIIMQQQHQQQQPQQQHTHLQHHQRITSNKLCNINNTTTTTSTHLPMQLQQQLKQNIITVHPIPQQQQQQQLQQQHHHHQLIGNAVSIAPNTTSTITLSPIIVNSTHHHQQQHNAYSADLFTDCGSNVTTTTTATISGADFISLKNLRTATPNQNNNSSSNSLSPQIITVPQASPLGNLVRTSTMVSCATNNNNNNSSINTTTTTTNNILSMVNTSLAAQHTQQ